MRPLLVCLSLIFLPILLVSCVAAPQVISDKKASSCALVYDLASDYKLSVSSPDLNLKLAAQRPVESDQFALLADDVQFDSASTSIDDLKVSLNSGKAAPQAGLLFHFSDQEGRLLDRAELDSGIGDDTWLLGLGLSTRTVWKDTGTPTYALGVVSELSGLWAPREVPAGREGKVLRVAEKTGVRSFAQASGIDEDEILTALQAEGVAGSPDCLLDAETWKTIGQRFGLRVEPQTRYYLAFHDVSAGIGGDGTRTFLLSLGGFLPEWGGEVVTTYRLLQYDDSAGFNTYRTGFTEQALGLTYAESFSGWVKYVSHTLSYFNYQKDGPLDDTLTEEDSSLADVPEDAEKWRNSTQVSVGSDLDRPFLGLIQGYRVDLSYAAEDLVLRSRVVDDRRSILTGGHLRLKTVLGTFYSRIQQSDTLRKLMFGVQKKGWANARLNLYVENIHPRITGPVETRVNGQLFVPMEGSLFEMLTFDFWKIAENNLFAPLKLRGYLAPSRGHHVSGLNNSCPGIVP